MPATPSRASVTCPFAWPRLTSRFRTIPSRREHHLVSPFFASVIALTTELTLAQPDFQQVSLFPFAPSRCRLELDSFTLYVFRLRAFASSLTFRSSRTARRRDADHARTLHSPWFRALLFPSYSPLGPTLADLSRLHSLITNFSMMERSLVFRRQILPSSSPTTHAPNLTSTLLLKC